jgi:hypothetical protein
LKIQNKLEQVAPEFKLWQSNYFYVLRIIKKRNRRELERVPAPIFPQK